MKKGLFRKGFVLGIIVMTLLIGTMIFPVNGQTTVSQNIIKNNDEISSEYFISENINYPLNNGLDEYLIDFMSENHIPGLSATIVKNDSVFWTNSYGYADISQGKFVKNTTLFLLASISKTIVATAIMQLYEQDCFDLYDPINDYLPFQVVHPDYPSTDITFHMLMTHTSSIKDNWGVMSYFPGDPIVPLGVYLEEYLTPEGVFYDPDLNFYDEEPGTYYDYSNIGVALIGYLVEVISNVNFSEYCETNIFQPLDMDETAWFLADLNISNIAIPYKWDGDNYEAYPHYSNNWYPSACLRTSIIQLRNHLIMMMNNGIYNSKQILQESTVSLILSSQLTWLPEQGLIWYIIYLNGRTLWGHSGSYDGCRTKMFFEPQTNIGVIVLINGEYNGLNDILVKLFDFTENEPPNLPCDPDPSDGETDVYINTTLSWDCSDPNGNEVTYDIYFGENTPPPKVKSNYTSKTYSPGLLEFDTKYYWKIIAWDEFDSSAEGPIWCFTTQENLPPYEPSNPDPPNEATDVPIVKILRWNGGDPNPGDKATYDVYFGTGSPPPLVDEDLTKTSYNPGTMDLGTTYYWQIVSEDSLGLTTTGPIWSFTTEEEPNEPPTAPEIDGPDKGKPGVELCWTFHSDDPNGNDVRYHIDWGDGSNLTNTTYYPACNPVEMCHTYAEKGTYTIIAIAEDIKEARSDEGTYEVIIPRERIVFFTLIKQLYERFPMLERLLSLIRVN